MVKLTFLFKFHNFYLFLNQVLIEHEHGITSIAVTNQNNYVVSGSKDKQVIFWSFKDGNVIHKLTGHTDAIVKVVITTDATVIFSGNVHFIAYGK